MFKYILALTVHMKIRRNRIVAAIVFAVTLILGVSTLAISWRLQQERQITEEEAAAAAVSGAFVCMAENASPDIDDPTQATPLVFLTCDYLNGDLYARENADSLPRENADSLQRCTFLQDDSGGTYEWIFKAPDGSNETCTTQAGNQDSCDEWLKSRDFSQCAVCGESWTSSTGDFTSPISIDWGGVSADKVTIKELTAVNYWPKIGRNANLQSPSSSTAFFQMGYNKANYHSNMKFKVVVKDNGTEVASQVYGPSEGVVCTPESASSWKPDNNVPADKRRVVCFLRDKEISLTKQSGHSYSVEAFVQIQGENRINGSSEFNWQTSDVCKGNYVPSNDIECSGMTSSTHTVTSGTTGGVITVNDADEEVVIKATGSDADGQVTRIAVCYAIGGQSQTYYRQGKYSDDSTNGIWVCDETTESLDGSYGVDKSYNGYLSDLQPIATRDNLTINSVVFVTNLWDVPDQQQFCTSSVGYDTGLLVGSSCSSNIPTCPVCTLGTNNCRLELKLSAPSAVCDDKSMYSGTTEISTVNPGDSVEFRVDYRNSGEVAGTVIMTDPIPSGFDLPQASSVSVESDTRTLTADNYSCSITNRIVRCEVDTNPGETGTITIPVTASSTISRGTSVENTATINIDIDDDGTNDGTDSTCSIAGVVTEANVACVEKSASPEGPVNPGDEVTYTVTYTVESGPAIVPISETLPEHLTLLTAEGYLWCDEGEDSDLGECNKDYGVTYTNSECNYDTTARLLSCSITEQDVGTFNNNVVFYTQVNESGIPLDGTSITNIITVGSDEGGDTCEETITVEHILPACIVTTPNILTVRVADLATTEIELTTRGDLGTHADLDFRWTATGGTLSSAVWHSSSGTPNDPTVGEVTDTVTWSPPTDAVDTDTFDIKVYVRPEGSTDSIGVSADECEATTTITALDLVCLYMIPNDPVGPFPFDMTFEADIGGNEGASFTYDLNFGDDSTHYTGSGTVAAGSTVELPYIPPQASPHTYDSTTPVSYAPSLSVINTETGEESICPTILPGTTVTDWTIVKDSDVDTCTPTNSQVAYTIKVTNAGDYSADLENVRDTLDAKINMSTVTNIRECDVNGANCTTYNAADVVSGHTITWPGRTFAPGQSRTYRYSVTVATPGDYYNIAEAVPTDGRIVRDDETFPTCAPGAQPVTGAFSSAVYAVILGVMLMMVSSYVYRTQTGAQMIANVLGKTKKGIWRKLNRKEAFERDAIKSVRKKRVT